MITDVRAGSRDVEPEVAASAPPDISSRLAGAQVVDRVVDILETFTRLGPELGVSEISRSLGLKKATTHRLLASLRRRGFVAQDVVSRRYRLGMKLWELGQMATTQVDWLSRVRPLLQELTDRVGETSHLAVLNDGQVLYVDKVESTRSLRMPSQVGRRLPAHCTGVGKALIAFLPKQVIRSLVAQHGLPIFTPNTIATLKQLETELAVVRERGYSVDNEEIEEGLVCIGAPIRDYSLDVIAAVSMAGPSSRVRFDTIPGHARAVLDAADAMSVALGATPAGLAPAKGDAASNALRESEEQGTAT